MVGELPIVTVVAVALVDVDGRILISQRPRSKPMAGLWEFPGGKIEIGESPEKALIREIKEELSVDLIPNSIKYMETFTAQAEILR